MFNFLLIDARPYPFLTSSRYSEPMSVRPTRPAPLLPPGTYIEEWLEGHPSTSREALAARLGVSPTHLGRLISGDAPVTAHTAAALASVTGCPADFWLVHEARYAPIHRRP